MSWIFCVCQKKTLFEIVIIGITEALVIWNWDGTHKYISFDDEIDPCDKSWKTFTVMCINFFNFLLFLSDCHLEKNFRNVLKPMTSKSHSFYRMFWIDSTNTLFLNIFDGRNHLALIFSVCLVLGIICNILPISKFISK